MWSNHRNQKSAKGVKGERRSLIDQTGYRGHEVGGLYILKVIVNTVIFPVKQGVTNQKGKGHGQGFSRSFLVFTDMSFIKTVMKFIWSLLYKDLERKA